jgi:hypothetical protein
LFGKHHYVSAATMKFNLSNAMIIRIKTSRDVLEQAPLKVGSGPKPHFSRKERCIFEKLFYRERLDIPSPAINIKA